MRKMLLKMNFSTGRHSSLNFYLICFFKRLATGNGAAFVALPNIIRVKIT
jgi:hypothetical protein